MKKLLNSQAVRYVFFGGCSTLVNLGSYYVLTRFLGMDLTSANTAAILIAILFAYVVNKLFVFEHRAESVAALLKEAGSFIGMRLGTMVVEVLGVILLSCIWGMHDMAAKLLIQVVIMILNYLISRFIVFKEDEGALQSEEEICMEKRRSRRFFAAGFFLSVLVAGIGFASLGVWPFGDKTVLIIDSLHQYLPFYTDFHEKLVNSESFLYSFSGGLGYNFWSTYAYYMASPFHFLMAFIPKENVCDFMDLMILLKIGLCSGCFSWYLHKRDPERKFLPVVFGMAFGLSNFVIGYYFNLMWLDSVAMLPLIMLGIERITSGKSGRLFCLSLFYGLWCNYYIGFMLCIFSCLYFLVRVISQKKIIWKQVGKSCLAFGWYALLAGGMAALILLPAFLGLGTSESVQGNTFPAVIRFYESLPELLENHLAFLEPVNISSSQVGLNVYCGILTVLAAVLYLFDRRIKLRERLAHCGLCAVLLFSFSFNILNYIWHGFHVQNGLPNRFAFLYIALLLVMACDALGHIRDFRIPALLFSVAVPAGFIIFCFFKGSGEIEPYVYMISLGLLIIYCGLLLLGRFMQNRNYSVYCGILSAVLLVEISANAIYGINCNGGVTRSIYIADQKSYQALMKDRDEDTFFRSEVDRQRMRNVTMYCGGNGMVMFNSTMQGSVIDFCDRLGIEARTNKNGYLGVTKLMNDVLGIRYVLSPSKVARTLYQFERVAEDGDLALYKNDRALSLGFMVNDSIVDWDIEASEPLLVQNSFVELATGLEPIYVLDRCIDMEDGQNYGIRIPENKQVYLCIDSRVAGITLNTPEYTKSYEDYTDHLYVINRSDESDMADFTVTLDENQTTVQAQVYTCSNEAYQKVIDRLSESQLTDVQVDGNLVSGSIAAKEDGTLLLTIPYDEGWRITVDGEEVPYFSIGKTLTGLPVTAGSHTIKMKFTPPGLWTGSIISMICVLLYLLSGVWEKKHPAWFRQEAEAQDDTQEEQAGEAETVNQNRNGEMQMQNLVELLRDAAGQENILEQESMKKHTTFRIGGPADIFAVPDTVQKAAQIIQICREKQVPYYVIGNGSNLLVSDRGYRGVVVQIYKNLSKIETEGDTITAQAGAMLSVIAKKALAASLTGFEFASGIPGTIGGAVVMNAGAYGGEMRNVLQEVTVLTKEGEIRTVPAEELQLGYRYSVIPEREWVVLEAKLRLQKGDPDQIRNRMEELKEQRVSKQPLDLPSAGSTFKRPQGYFAGKLIMDAGLRGFSVGGAQVSEKHCGFVVNTGDATAEDVRELIAQVSDRVQEQFGASLEPEVKMLGEF